jgi:hypothetical protein
MAVGERRHLTPSIFVISHAESDLEPPSPSHHPLLQHVRQVHRREIHRVRLHRRLQQILLPLLQAE